MDTGQSEWSKPKVRWQTVRNCSARASDLKDAGLSPNWREGSVLLTLTLQHQFIKKHGIFNASLVTTNSIQKSPLHRQPYYVISINYVIWDNNHVLQKYQYKSKRTACSGWGHSNVSNPCQDESHACVPLRKGSSKKICSVCSIESLLALSVLLTKY